METTDNREPLAARQQQARLSRMLIAGITIAMLVYMNCTYTSENDMLYQSVMICPVVAVLIGMYTFTYRGKAFRVSRILFYIFLVLSLFSLGILYYIIGLSASYSH